MATLEEKEIPLRKIYSERSLWFTVASSLQSSFVSLRVRHPADNDPCLITGRQLPPSSQPFTLPITPPSFSLSVVMGVMEGVTAQTLTGDECDGCDGLKENSEIFDKRESDDGDIGGEILEFVVNGIYPSHTPQTLTGTDESPSHAPITTHHIPSQPVEQIADICNILMLVEEAEDAETVSRQLKKLNLQIRKAAWAALSVEKQQLMALKALAANSDRTVFKSGDKVEYIGSDVSLRGEYNIYYSNGDKVWVTSNKKTFDAPSSDFKFV